MGSDDEWRYIRKGMGREHEGSDRGGHEYVGHESEVAQDAG